MTNNLIKRKRKYVILSFYMIIFVIKNKNKSHSVAESITIICICSLLFSDGMKLNKIHVLNFCGKKYLYSIFDKLFYVHIIEFIIRILNKLFVAY